MGVDVVDVGRADAGALDGGAHGAEAAIAIGCRRGDVVGVAAQTIANDFAIDLGAARLGTLIVFEHDNAGAFAHDETIAVLVIGARCRFGIVVEIGGKRAGSGEAGQCQPVDAAFRASGDHHVGIA